MTEKEELFDLCRNHGCALNKEIFEQCATFLFYTSWYEELLFNNNRDERHSPENDKKICEVLCVKYHIDITAYDNFGIYFANRYIKPTGGKTDKFRNLKLNSAYLVFTCLKAFKLHRTRSSDLLWSYLQIVYRFRNNMFHGSKGLIHLPTYINEFKQINAFMHQFISDILNSGYEGFND